MDPNPVNEPSATPKQQVVERVRQANNVLVTVRTNPTVDELSATIGLTLMLNKLGKHATAVFSGEVPSTLEFLRPEETIETNTDSLRDFIISLDKSKADKLRYKVEENVVKIFITPYRTSITQNDLDFSQGDFNVDVVLALGVTQREELDQAIVAHGRILHDATVVTITSGQRESNLGAINWQEPAASSLSEMLVSISEAFQGGLIDGQIATAFLTGIVAETERFSNLKTTPKVMTMAAQLMAAGANQQLIANELQKTEEVASVPEVEAPAEAPLPEVGSEPPKNEDGTLSIEHAPEEAASEMPVETSPNPMSATEEPPVSTEEAVLPLPEPSPEVVAQQQENVEETPLVPIQEPMPEAPSVEAQPTFGSILPPLPTESLPSTPSSNNSTDIHIDEDGNVIPAGTPPATKRKVIEPLEHAEEPEPVSTATVNPPAFAAMEPASTLPPLPEALNAQDQPASESPDTLLEIEQSVHSPHLGEAQSQESDADSIRNAIADIHNQRPFDPAVDPSRADLNAQPLGQELPQSQPLPPLPNFELPSPEQQPTPQQKEDKDLPDAPPLPPPFNLPQ